MRSPTTHRHPTAILMGLAALALVACGGERTPPVPGDAPDDPPSAPAPTTPAPPEEPSADPDAAPDEEAPDDVAPAEQTWTVGVVSVEATVGAGSALPVVGAVRTAGHPGYDRLTVELEPDPDGGGMPGYRVEYVDRPLHQCGSGAQIHPVGDGWLELRLEPARAHTEAGEPTLSGRELPAAGAVARRIYLTCDFEGIVTLVLAVDAPNPYRVFTLGAPRRIVLDVRR